MDSTHTYRGLENSWLSGRWEGGWSSRGPACTSRGGGQPGLCPCLTGSGGPGGQLPGCRGTVPCEEAVRADPDTCCLSLDLVSYMVAMMACSCHFLLLIELELPLGFRIHIGYRRVGVNGRLVDRKATRIKAWDLREPGA